MSSSNSTGVYLFLVLRSHLPLSSGPLQDAQLASLQLEVGSFIAWQIDRCFGFESAVEEAQRALLAAKVEASSAFRGVGLVKLMGRQSGFIAMQASMASGVVDICLIPEVLLSTCAACMLQDCTLSVACPSGWLDREMQVVLAADQGASERK